MSPSLTLGSIHLKVSPPIPVAPKIFTIPNATPPTGDPLFNSPATLEKGWADAAYCAANAAKLPAEVAEGDRLKAQIQRLYARWESLEAMKAASV